MTSKLGIEVYIDASRAGPLRRSDGGILTFPMLGALTTTVTVAAIYASLLLAVHVLFRRVSKAQLSSPDAADIQDDRDSDPSRVGRASGPLPPPAPLSLPLMEFEMGGSVPAAGEADRWERPQEWRQEPEPEPEPPTSLARLTDKLVAALESPAIKRPKLRELLAMSAPLVAASGRAPRTQPRREVEALRHAYDGDSSRVSRRGPGGAAAAPSPGPEPEHGGGPLREAPAERLPMIEIGDGSFGSEEALQAESVTGAEGPRTDGLRAEPQRAAQPATAEERVMRMHIRATGM